MTSINARPRDLTVLHADTALKHYPGANLCADAPLAGPFAHTQHHTMLDHTHKAYGYSLPKVIPSRHPILSRRPYSVLTMPPRQTKLTC